LVMEIGKLAPTVGRSSVCRSRAASHPPSRSAAENATGSTPAVFSYDGERLLEPVPKRRVCAAEIRRSV
jgi:hypothetical protein